MAGLVGAANGVGVGREDVDGAVGQAGLDFLELGGGAFGGNSLVQLKQLDGAGLDGAGPVGGNGLAIGDAVDDVLKVGSPVDAGGDDVGVGAGFLGGAVVGDVGNAVRLADVRSAHGVGMLGDQDAVAVDQLLSAFLLKGHVVPGTGEGDLHGDAGADGLRAEEEGGVAGDDFGVGVGADVTHNSLFSGDLAALDHLVELQTGGNTGEEAAFIDGSERVVEVGKAFGVGLGAGGMAELDIRALLGGLDHVVLVTEGVGEDDVAALVNEVQRGLIALLAFGNTGLQNVLNAQLLAGFLGGVHEVLVIGGLLVMQEHKADLDGLGLGGGLRSGSGLFGSGSSLFGGGSLVRSGGSSLAAGGERKDHRERKDQSKNLFHLVSPFFIFRLPPAIRSKKRTALPEKRQGQCEKQR